MKTLSDEIKLCQPDKGVIFVSDVKNYLNKFIEGIRTNPTGYMQETGEGRIVIADWERLKLLKLEIFGEDFA